MSSLLHCRCSNPFHLGYFWVVLWNMQIKATNMLYSIGSHVWNKFFEWSMFIFLSNNNILLLVLNIPGSLWLLLHRLVPQHWLFMIICVIPKFAEAVPHCRATEQFFITMSANFWFPTVYIGLIFKTYKREDTLNFSYNIQSATKLTCVGCGFHGPTLSHRTLHFSFSAFSWCLRNALIAG